MADTDNPHPCLDFPNWSGEGGGPGHRPGGDCLGRVGRSAWLPGVPGQRRHGCGVTAAPAAEGEEREEARARGEAARCRPRGVGSQLAPAPSSAPARVLRAQDPDPRTLGKPFLHGAWILDSAPVRAPAGCPEKPSGLVPGPAPRSRHCRGLRQLCGQSARALAAFSRRCLGSPACPIRSDAAADTSSEITTKDFKEKKEVVEEAENGRDAPANGNANEENGEQEADNQVDEEEEEDGGGGEGGGRRRWGCMGCAGPTKRGSHLQWLVLEGCSFQRRALVFQRLRPPGSL
ncbi:hypothetical protein HPG69_006962 [Diceros bicornis minor]|uniref:Prothymosin alpha n=1 Tax=Diceros bicornis minor TaxID=77932 RepID=A0A7J7ENQ7_DICBM|nr:hypothetical protein HPG69_006962 [Diceros bicornis minor]